MVTFARSGAVLGNPLSKGRPTGLSSAINPIS
jgi:hypothetical protein